MTVAPSSARASSATDPLAAARALRPLIEAEADATDRELTLTKPVIEAFTDTKLFHIMVPAALGGLEADTDTLIDVFEELAHQDGSIGWTQMANASATSYVAFLEPALAREMVGDKPGNVFAGQFAPRGSAKRADAGFRVGGSYGFGSGSGHAAYLGGGGFVTGDDGAPEILPSGLPAYLCWFVDKQNVEMQGGWDVMGLRGTGSFDYEIPEQVIDAGRSFLLFEAEVHTGGTLYRMGPTALAGIGHAGWGLGVAQRALDEIEQIARSGRARMSSGSIKDQPVFQRELGEKSLALRSVRLLVHDVFRSIVARLAEGGPMDKGMNADIMGATAYMTQVCQDVTLFAYSAAGSQGLRNPSRIQRCFRDMFTGGQHIYVDRGSYEQIAKEKLGIEDVSTAPDAAATTLEFFYDIGSPWTYLAFHRIEAVAREGGARLVWKPILVGGVFNAVNPAVYEARANPVPSRWRYMKKDMADWARSYGLRIHWPPSVFPVNSVKAMRGALHAQDESCLEAYSRAAFEAYWGEDRDISRPEVLFDVARQVGLDPQAFGDAIASPALKERLRANTQELIDRGGFGSPTMILAGDDLYFGNDRLPLVREALARRAGA